MMADKGDGLKLVSALIEGDVDQIRRASQPETSP
jgi:hypothetical protein